MKSERRNLTQPADHWAAFERRARSEGYTLSEWVGECCKFHLTAGAEAGLSERPALGRPKKTRPNELD